MDLAYKDMTPIKEASPEGSLVLHPPNTHKDRRPMYISNSLGIPPPCLNEEATSGVEPPETTVSSPRTNPTSCDSNNNTPESIGGSIKWESDASTVRYDEQLTDSCKFSTPAKALPSETLGVNTWLPTLNAVKDVDVGYPFGIPPQCLKDQSTSSIEPLETVVSTPGTKYTSGNSNSNTPKNISGSIKWATDGSTCDEQLIDSYKFPTPVKVVPSETPGGGTGLHTTDAVKVDAVAQPGGLQHYSDWVFHDSVHSTGAAISIGDGKTHVKMGSKSCAQQLLVEQENTNGPPPSLVVQDSADHPQLPLVAQESTDPVTHPLAAKGGTEQLPPSLALVQAVAREYQDQPESDNQLSSLVDSSWSVESQSVSDSETDTSGEVTSGGSEAGLAIAEWSPHKTSSPRKAGGVLNHEGRVGSEIPLGCSAFSPGYWFTSQKVSQAYRQGNPQSVARRLLPQIEKADERPLNLVLPSFRSRYIRSVYTAEQKRVLEEQYAMSFRNTKARRTALSQELNLSDLDVSRWFRNRRARELAAIRRKPQKTEAVPTVSVPHEPPKIPEAVASHGAVEPFPWQLLNEKKMVPPNVIAPSTTYRYPGRPSAALCVPRGPTKPFQLHTAGPSTRLPLLTRQPLHSWPFTHSGNANTLPWQPFPFLPPTSAGASVPFGGMDRHCAFPLGRDDDTRMVSPVPLNVPLYVDTGVFSFPSCRFSQPLWSPPTPQSGFSDFSTVNFDPTDRMQQQYPFLPSVGDRKCDFQSVASTLSKASPSIQTPGAEF